MRIAVLSRKPHLYSTQRLVTAGADRGHEMEVIDYLRCYMDITSHRPVVMLRGEKLHRFDAVIPRIAGIHTLYGTAVVRQFELMGVFAVNQSEAITRAHDKLHQLQLLAQSGVHLPVTGFANDIGDISGLVDAVGGPPLLVKLLRGAQGKGVVLTENRKAAESVVSAFRQLNANILIQQFIKGTRGADIRAFVVGRRVVAAMQRQAAPGDFRANIHRGGKASEVELTPEERRIAVRAARRIGLRVAGVDMMRPADGPVVLEVNGSPGLQGIEGVTGVDVAGEVVRYVERAARRVNGAKSRRTKAKRST